MKIDGLPEIHARSVGVASLRIIEAMPTLIADFATHLGVERNRRPRTIAAYVEVLEHFAAFLRTAHAADGEALLEVADRAEVARFLHLPSTKTGEPSSPAVFNRQLSALRTFFAWLVSEEVVTVNPALMIRHKKVDPREVIPLDFDQMLRLVDAVEDADEAYRARDTALVQVFLHCGLRVTSLVSIDLSNVDLEQHHFVGLVVKGGKAVNVPFNDIVAEAIERYLSERKAADGEGALFTSNRGTRISVRAVQDRIGLYAERAKLTTHTTPHVLRHSNASALASIGVDVVTVKDHLAQKSITTTQRYLHAEATAVRAAVNAFGAEWKRRGRAAARSGRKRPRRVAKKV